MVAPFSITTKPKQESSTVYFGIPVAPGVAGAVGDVVSQLAVFGAHAELGLVVVHNPQRHIQRVGAYVDKRAAALLVFVEKHALRGHRPAPQRVRLGK